MPKKPNYNFEKRQKELARQQKKENKRQEKAERKQAERSSERDPVNHARRLATEPFD